MSYRFNKGNKYLTHLLPLLFTLFSILGTPTYYE